MVAIVDDESIIRKTTARFLKRMNLACETIADGSLLLPRFLQLTHASFSEEPGAPTLVHPPPAFTVILLDIVMRSSNGAAVCRCLREAGVTVPIYAMTANSDSASQVVYRESGFSGMLGKPFTKEDLADVLRRAMEGNTEWSGKLGTDAIVDL